MIRDVDLTIADWIGSLLPGASISFESPRDLADEPPGHPTLLVHLHEVREDSDAGTAGWEDVRSSDGVLVGRYPPLRSYRFTYLVTAWAGETLAEHELLGDLLVASAAHPFVPDHHLQGFVSELRGVLMVRCAPDRQGVDTRDLWAAWRIPPRTALELTALVPLPSTMLATAGEPPRQIDLHTGRSVSAPGPGNGLAAPGQNGTPRPRPAARIDEG